MHAVAKALNVDVADIFAKALLLTIQHSSVAMAYARALERVGEHKCHAAEARSTAHERSLQWKVYVCRRDRNVVALQYGAA